MRLLVVAMLLWSAAAGAAQMLLFSVTEPEGEPYPSRVIVNDRFVRVDDGVDSGDFILMERDSGTVYSVVHSDRTLFTIPARPVSGEPPTALNTKTVTVPMGADAPKVAGRQPQHRRLDVNGSACHNVVSVDLMPDAVAALRQFRRTLAGQRALSLPALPADLQQPCDLTVNVYRPEWPLQFGLPIQEWSAIEKRARALVDYSSDFAADASLFNLPEGYETFSAGP